MQSKIVQEHHKQSMKQSYGVEHALQLDKFKNKASNTNKDRYGVEWVQSNPEIKQKSRNTMKERYGAETTLQSQELSKKARQTMQDRYHTDNPMKVEKFKQLAKQTNTYKYGVENPMQAVDIAEKSRINRLKNIETTTQHIKDTFLEKYGVDNPSKLPEVQEKISNKLKEKYPEFQPKMIDTNMGKYGVPFYCMSEECRKLSGCAISKVNQRFSEELDQRNIEHSVEFTLERYSYDVRINNTLIEINPTYTHNVVGNHWNAPVDWDYHLKKTQIANKHGYRCIHVFDWDDQEKLLNMLSNPKYRISAHKCSIYVLNTNIGSQFLNRYHLQGACRGPQLYLGLVYQTKLVYVMAFTTPRYNKQYDAELVRFCSHPEYKVFGGASKLFKFFITNYEVTSIISYCDISKFTGDTYEHLGMHLLKSTQPQEIWSRHKKHITANLLRAHGYQQLVDSTGDPNKSNEENLLADGWLPVYDCGQAVYVFE
jgi:hypothetical protein